MKKIVFALTLLLAGMQFAHADFNDGVVAYLMGNYQQAYATMRPLAETANFSLAQYYLGMMYLNGQGVDQSYKKAGKWFLKAAEQGIPQAQYKLGMLYFKGQGLPLDFVRAYAWFRTGASHHHELSIKAVPKAKAELSAAELKDAEQLAGQYIKKYGPSKKPQGSENTGSH